MAGAGGRLKVQADRFLRTSRPLTRNFFDLV